MHQPKIVVLGSSGFVGGNISELLEQHFAVFNTTRDDTQVQDGIIYFDLENEDTWQNLLACKPDIIINSAGYGVVKYQNDFARMQQINYYRPYRLKQHLDEKLRDYFWIQIGSAFEYDLSVGALTEQSPTMPLTQYGISKLLFSQFLQNAGRHNFVVLRPFAMFGPGEDTTKIIPALILAQKEKKVINLSSGLQKRDYFFVHDLATFVRHLIDRDIHQVSGEVINVGSNTSVALRELAEKMTPFISHYDRRYWNWGEIDQRQNESDTFHNASSKAANLGFSQTPREKAIITTINYYFN